MWIDHKTLTEIGLIFDLIGAFLIALPAFKSKLEHTFNYNPVRIDVNSTRSGLIALGIGFTLQLIALNIV